MSRVGRKIINVPAGVTVEVANDNTVTVKGPKGTLVKQFSPVITIEQEGSVITVKRSSELKQHKQLHGTTRAILANMVEGVHNGYKKDLEIVGIGYRAAMQGKDLVLTVGYSHTVTMVAPEGITIAVPAPNQVVVSGPDKQKVGQFASEVRGVRPPEPYKGKGIRYAGEYVRRKEGKAGKGGK